MFQREFAANFGSGDSDSRPPPGLTPHDEIRATSRALQCVVALCRLCRLSSCVLRCSVEIARTLAAARGRLTRARLALARLADAVTAFPSTTCVVLPVPAAAKLGVSNPLVT